MRARHIVEFGILLDVLAGVMIMAVILQNIKQTFDDVDTALAQNTKGIGGISWLKSFYLIPLLTGPIIAFFLPARIKPALLDCHRSPAPVPFRSGLGLPAWRRIFRIISVTPEGLLSLLVISLLFFLISIYTIAYLSKIGDPFGTHLHRLHAAVSVHHDHGDPVRSHHGDVDRHRGHHPGQCAADLHPPLGGLPGGHLEVCADLLGGHRHGPFGIGAHHRCHGCGRRGCAHLVFRLTDVAGQLDPFWLKTGFVFILVGYGTKMGLAPMHTWLPDAHSEAPSPASALLSGVCSTVPTWAFSKPTRSCRPPGWGIFPAPC
jgi:hydrogenase-4 component F